MVLNPELAFKSRCNRIQIFYEKYRKFGTAVSENGSAKKNAELQYSPVHYSDNQAGASSRVNVKSEKTHNILRGRGLDDCFLLKPTGVFVSLLQEIALCNFVLMNGKVFFFFLSFFLAFLRLLGQIRYRK